MNLTRCFFLFFMFVLLSAFQTQVKNTYTLYVYSESTSINVKNTLQKKEYAISKIEQDASKSYKFTIECEKELDKLIHELNAAFNKVYYHNGSCFVTIDKDGIRKLYFKDDEIKNLYNIEK